MVMAKAEAAELERRVAEVQLKITAAAERLAETRARLSETHTLVLTKRSERKALHDLVYARLLARVESMPVLEQAKGIMMAQTGCGAEDALEMLDSASRRGKVSMSVLAAQIVAQIAAGEPSAAPR